MNYPTVHSYDMVATDTVSRVINAALEKVGKRLTLSAMAATRVGLCKAPSFTDRVVDAENLVRSSEDTIVHVIDKVWRTSQSFKYILKFLEYCCDECAQYYHFEALFSQPTVMYPVPQATASVFFTVRVSLIHGSGKAPKVTYRLEGHHQEHDIRYVKLPEDWLYGVLKMKIKFFKTVEDFDSF